MRFGERRGGRGHGGDRDYGERRGGMGGGFREPPVKVGEEYDVQITDIAAKGDGIAKIEGFIIFVPGTTKGDSCRIRVKEVARRFAVAEKVGDAGSAPAAGEPAEEEMPVEEEETQ